MSGARLATDDAIARLDVIPDYDAGAGAGPCVHTYLEAGFGLLGAHWYLDAIRALIEEHGAEEAGPVASANGHGVVVRHPGGPLFLATRDGSES